MAFRVVPPPSGPVRTVRVRGRTLQEHDLECPDCGDSMAVMTDGSFTGYRCRHLECRGIHACHPDGSPVGTPADASTRKARARAHEAFDRLWRTDKMSRTDAYAWLSEKLGVPKDDCHIGLFDAPTCRKLIKAVKDCYPELFPFEDVGVS